MKKLFLTFVISAGVAGFAPAAFAEDEYYDDHNRRSVVHVDIGHQRPQHSDYYSRDYHSQPYYQHNRRKSSRHYRSHRSTAHEAFHEVLGH